jgi:hypothetical protein
MTKGLAAFPDPSKPMMDIYDGWGWRAIQAGLERRRGGEWTIRDVDVRNLHQRFVSLPLGLVWQMNIDWYVKFTLMFHFIISTDCVIFKVSSG